MSVFPLTVTSQKTRLTTMLGAVPMLAPKLALFTNDYIPDMRTILADLVEATFAGYTAGGATLTWGAVGYDANGIPCAAAPATWTATGAGPAELAYGAYLLDSTGGLVGAGRFDSPVSFAFAGDQGVVVIQFGLVQATIVVALGP